MKRLDLWKLSVLNVFSSPVRSMLTVLGFAIGVAAILAVLTLGDAGREQVQSEMGRLGIDRIWLTEEEGFPQQTGRWLAQMTGLQAQELAAFPVRAVSKRTSADVMAVGCEGAYLADVQIVKGRGFLPVDELRETDAALVGESAAERLGVDVGDWIQLGPVCLTVCGIAGEKEGISSVPLKEAVILPLNAACRLTGGRVTEIQLSAGEGRSIQNAQKQAVYLLETQGYAPEATSMEVQMEAASSVIFTFVSVLGWVALVCILVGGIGVMNILLVSIRERRREIGVMKSLGTTPYQICVLFLLEALVYAGIGGVLGLLLGMGLIAAAGQSIQLSASASLSDCVTVLACALGTGLLFGVLPALRASFLNCVDALRQE